MKLIILGIKQTSLLAKFYFENDSAYSPCFYCLDSKYIESNQKEDLPIICFDDINEIDFPKDEFAFFVPFSNNKERQSKVNELINKGYKLASYVSSKSIVQTKDIGYNCFILEQNNIQPYVSIGDNVILWSGNHIGHHSKICSNIFFSSHVVVSGNCLIKDYCWFGVNSCIRDNLIIEEGTFLAMGSVVMKNTKPYTKYMGNPAKDYGSFIL